MQPPILRATFTLTLLAVLRCSVAQSLTTNTDFFGRSRDARAEAMGMANVGLTGDTRNMLYNPAALSDLRGLEVYAHQASPWYILESSRFSTAALAYRLGPRWAVGLAFERTELKSELLTFGDQIDPHRGFAYTTNALPFGTSDRYSVIVAYRPEDDLSVGVCATSAPSPHSWSEQVRLNAGLLRVFHLRGDTVGRRTIRLGLALRNALFGVKGYTVDGPAGSTDYTETIPAIASAALAWRTELHKGWWTEKLPSLVFTVQLQADNDLTQRYRSAVRLGGEVLFLGVLALRGGWYEETVDDYGSPEFNKSRLSEPTYGVGINLPLNELTGSKVPLTIAADYCSLPQASYSTSEENPWTDSGWEDFQSIGLRVNYRVGMLLKPRAPAAP